MTTPVGYEFGFTSSGDRQVMDSMRGISREFNVLEQDARRTGQTLSELGPSTERSARLARDATERLTQEILGLERQTAFNTLAAQNPAYIAAVKRSQVATEGLKAALGDVRVEAEHTEDALEDVGSVGTASTGSLTQGIATMATAWNQGLELVDKFVAGLQQVYALAQEGAGLVGIEQSFQKLGNSAEDMERLRVATAGVFDDATMQKAHTLADTFHLSDEALAAFAARAAITGDQMGDLAHADELLIEVLESFGEESDEAAEAMGKIGLAATDVMTEAERAAFAMGEEFNDLTEAQKAQLISQAAVNDAMAKGVDVGDSLAVRLQASATSVENLQQEMLKFFAETLAESGALDVVTDALEIGKQLFEENKDTIKALVDDGMKAMTAMLPVVGQQLQVTLPILEALSPAIILVATAMEGTMIPMRVMVDMMQLLGGAVVTLVTGGLAMLIEAGAELADAFGEDELAASLHSAEDALNSIAEGAMDFTMSQVDQLGDEIEHGIDVLNRFGGGVVDLGEKIWDLGNESNETTKKIRQLYLTMEHGLDVGQAQDFADTFEKLGALGQIEDLDNLTAVIVGGAQNRQEALGELTKVENDMFELLDEYDRLIDSAETTRFGEGVIKDGMFISLDQLEAERLGIVAFGDSIDGVAAQIETQFGDAASGGSKKAGAKAVNAFVAGFEGGLERLDIADGPAFMGALLPSSDQAGAYWDAFGARLEEQFEGRALAKRLQSETIKKTLDSFLADTADALGGRAGIYATRITANLNAQDEGFKNPFIEQIEQERVVHEQRLDMLDELRSHLVEVKGEATAAMSLFGSDIDPVAEKWATASDFIGATSEQFLADLSNVIDAGDDLGKGMAASSSLIINAGQSATRAFIQDKKTLAITEAVFAGAKGLFALGEGFLGNPAAFIAAGEYFASAAAYGILAGSTGGAPKSKSTSGGGAPSRPTRTTARSSDRPERRREETREVNQITLRALFSARQGVGVFNDYGQRNTGVKLNSSLVSADPLTTDW